MGAVMGALVLLLSVIECRELLIMVRETRLTLHGFIYGQVPMPLGLSKIYPFGDKQACPPVNHGKARTCRCDGQCSTVL
jgi:hypothetical protein